MISPPWEPEPGPSSMTVSASQIVASSCSTTSTVLPRFCRGAKCTEQTLVVARMQADGRLVQNVYVTPTRPGAQLRGQANALGLAAGKRVHGAPERKIIQADIFHKGQAAGDFPLSSGSATRACLPVNSRAASHLRARSTGRSQNWAIFRSPTRTERGFRPQPGPLAVRAVAGLAGSGQFVPPGIAVPHPLLEKRNNACQRLSLTTVLRIASRALAKCAAW